MTTTRLSGSACHRCGAINDAATPVDQSDRTPKPGDAMLCIACGALAVYTEDSTRAPTAPEMKELLADPEIRNAVRAMNRFHQLQRFPTAPPPEESNGDTHLPCGCVFGTRGDVFFIRPCSLTCEVYAYAQAAAKKQGKQMHVATE
jgi:hypothetical protein